MTLAENILQCVAAVRALEATSTPGPWRRGQSGNPRVYGADGSGQDSGLIVSTFKQSANSNLLVLSRNALLAQCDVMAVLASMLSKHENWCDCFNEPSPEDWDCSCTTETIDKLIKLSAMQWCIAVRASIEVPIEVPCAKQ